MRRRGRPVVARIDLLQDKRRRDTAKPILALKWDETLHRPTDLNFALVLPIFDYRTISYETGNIDVEPVEEAADCVASFDTGIDGAIIGAFAIDGFLTGLRADIMDVANQLLDTGLLMNLERYALEVGCIFSKQVTKTFRP
jgi:hypothetical protein